MRATLREHRTSNSRKSAGVRSDIKDFQHYRELTLSPDVNPSHLELELQVDDEYCESDRSISDSN
jgi:hypothetical protein